VGTYRRKERDRTRGFNEGGSNTSLNSEEGCRFSGILFFGGPGYLGVGTSKQGNGRKKEDYSFRTNSSSPKPKEGVGRRSRWRLSTFALVRRKKKTMVRGASLSLQKRRVKVKPENILRREKSSVRSGLKFRESSGE